MITMNIASLTRLVDFKSMYALEIIVLVKSKFSLETIYWIHAVLLPYGLHCSLDNLHLCGKIKVLLFREGHKKLAQFSPRFWHCHVTSKPWGRLHQIFVTFSEKLNFATLNMKSTFKSWFLRKIWLYTPFFTLMNWWNLRKLGSE